MAGAGARRGKCAGINPCARESARELTRARGNSLTRSRGMEPVCVRQLTPVRPRPRRAPSPPRAAEGLYSPTPPDRGMGDPGATSPFHPRSSRSSRSRCSRAGFAGCGNALSELPVFLHAHVQGLCQELGHSHAPAGAAEHQTIQFPQVAWSGGLASVGMSHIVWKSCNSSLSGLCR